MLQTPWKWDWKPNDPKNALRDIESEQTGQMLLWTQSRKAFLLFLTQSNYTFITLSHPIKKSASLKLGTRCDYSCYYLWHQLVIAFKFLLNTTTESSQSLFKERGTFPFRDSSFPPRNNKYLSKGSWGSWALISLDQSTNSYIKIYPL